MLAFSTSFEEEIGKKFLNLGNYHNKFPEMLDTSIMQENKMASYHLKLDASRA